MEGIDGDDIKPETYMRVSQLQGEVLVLLGRFSEAEEVFSNSQTLAATSKSTLVEAEILAALADISLKQGNADKALSMHREALEKFIQLEDAKGAARSYNNMGYMLRRKNDRVKALEAYGEVEAILQESDGIELIGSQLILARSFLDLGEIDRARDHALQAFERTDGGDDHVLHARAQAVLGSLLRKSR